MHRKDRPVSPADRTALVYALVAVALAAGLAVSLPIGTAMAAGNYPPLTGSASGPNVLAEGGRGVYHVTASGGPAIAPNGTQVGIFSFHTSYSGSNTTGGSFNPPAGVLVNGQINVTFVAPNATESITLTFEVNSSAPAGGANQTINITYGVQIVQPYRLQATIVVVGSASVSGFPLTVSLDGSPVGAVDVPALAAGASYPVTFNYATLGLSPGWHTFSMTVAPEHGLVTFVGGAESFSTNFYVQPPPPDYTIYYVLGASTAVVAILILVLRVGPRRRRKK